MRATLLLVVAGCGRIDFAVRSDAQSDTRPDAPLPCGASAIVPDPITVSGNTYRYIAFDNTHTPVPDVTVSVLDTDDSAIAMSISDAGGSYSVDVPTGETARTFTLAYAGTGFFGTHVYPGRAPDRDITGAGPTLWELGDAPLWNASAMTAVYNTLSLTRSVDRGTVNIAIRTCGGAPIAGVTVTLDPAPEAIGYTTSSGIALDGTETPSSHAVAFNAIGGPTHITAVADGLTFPEIEIVVQAGDVNTLTILQPYE